MSWNKSSPGGKQEQFQFPTGAQENVQLLCHRPNIWARDGYHSADGSSPAVTHSHGEARKAAVGIVWQRKTYTHILFAVSQKSHNTQRLPSKDPWSPARNGFPPWLILRCSHCWFSGTADWHPADITETLRPSLFQKTGGGGGVGDEGFGGNHWGKSAPSPRNTIMDVSGFILNHCHGQMLGDVYVHALFTTFTHFWDHIFPFFCVALNTDSGVTQKEANNQKRNDSPTKASLLPHNREVKFDFLII